MPTTRAEAEKICEIINEYLEPTVAAEVTKRLNSEVGVLTDNQSLKDSLHMLASLYSEGNT